MTKLPSKTKEEQIRYLIYTAGVIGEIIYERWRKRDLSEDPEMEKLYYHAMSALQTCKELREQIGFIKPSTELEQIEIKF